MSLCVLVLAFLLSIYQSEAYIKNITTTPISTGKIVVELNVPITLYGKKYKKVEVYSNGIISLDGTYNGRKLRSGDFQKHAIIAPLYSEIYLKKKITVEVTRERRILEAFTKAIRQKFFTEGDFRAEELVFISWEIYVAFSTTPMQTIRTVIGSNGKNTFIQNSFEKTIDNERYDTFRFFVYGRSIAGYSAGDQVRYHMIFNPSEYRQTRGFDEILLRYSNMNSPGRWLVGSLESHSFSLIFPDPEPESNLEDEDPQYQCFTRNKKCSSNARCVAKECHCSEGYMGNGGACLLEDTNFLVVGTINGNLNGRILNSVQNYIYVNHRLKELHVSVNPLEKELSDIFLYVTPIYGIISWFVADNNNGIKNGFSIAGDRLIALTVIDFIDHPGKELYINQKLMGYANGQLTLHTTIQGNTTDLSECKADISASNPTEYFRQSADGLIFSSTSVNAGEKNHGPIKVTRLVNYKPTGKGMVSKNQMKVSVKERSYSQITGATVVLKVTLEPHVKDAKLNGRVHPGQRGGPDGTAITTTLRSTAKKSTTQQPNTKTAELATTKKQSSPTEPTSTTATTTEKMSYTDNTAMKSSLLSSSKTTLKESVKATRQAPKKSTTKRIFEVMSKNTPSFITTTKLVDFASMASTQQAVSESAAKIRTDYALKTSKATAVTSSDSTAKSNSETMSSTSLSSKPTVTTKTTPNSETTLPGDDALLLVQGGAIKLLKIPYSLDKLEYVYSDYSHVLVDVEYTCENKHVFFTDASDKSIKRVTLRNQSDVHTIVSGLGFPEGLSIDKYHNNIYWTDSQAKTINIARLDGRNHKVIAHKNVTNPRGILAYYIEQRLYWTDWDRKNPKIEYSRLDGSRRRVFADSSVVKTPNGLAVDHRRHLLCWTDVGLSRVACANLDPPLRQVRILQQELPHPFGLTFFKHGFAWTDWKSDRVQLVDHRMKMKRKNFVPGFERDGRLYSIKHFKCLAPY